MKKLNWPTIAVLFTCGSFLISKTGSYLPFISDDAFISLRYAQRLLDGQGLTWTAGQPVEGYSNLLWVLAVATLGLFGTDLVFAARLLGVACMAGVLVALGVYLARRHPTWTAAVSALAGSLFLAFSAPIAVWGIGGLEQPLYGLLLAAAIALMPAVLERTGNAMRAAIWVSVPLGLLCLTRPDGPIFTVTAVVAVLVSGWVDRRPRPIAHAVVTAVVPVALTIGQFLFRLAYYGTAIPNTALVKVAATSTHRTFGFEYLSSGIGSFWPFSMVAAVGLIATVASRRTRGQGLFLILSGLAWSAYVVFVGGDVFPAYRHLIPLIVILAFATSEGAALVLERLRSMAVASHVAAALVVVLAVIPYARVQADDKWIKRAQTERWEWQARDLALILKSAFGAKEPLLAVTAAGALPYYSELPALDMMGLNDYYLPRHRPANFGSGMVGHELGDGKYVLERQPDLIVFDVGSPQPSWRTGEELNAMPAFHDAYVPVRMRVLSIPDGAVVFVLKHSARIGYQSTPEAVNIPGFLFTGPDASAELAASGLVARLGTSPAKLSISFGNDQPIWDAIEIDLASSRLENADATVERHERTVIVTVVPRGDGASVERVVLKRR